MPKMITGKKTQQYSTEFKVKAVEWSHQAHRSVKSVAEALDIHPFMLSRWCKEYREGKRVKKAPADAKSLKRPIGQLMAAIKNCRNQALGTAWNRVFLQPRYVY